MKILSLDEGKEKVVSSENIVNIPKLTRQQVIALGNDTLLALKYVQIIDKEDSDDWYVDPSDTNTTPDDGTVILSSGGLRIKRRLDKFGRGFINASWFGLKNDCQYGYQGLDIPSGTDNTEAFRKAISAVPVGGVLFVPKGQYLISDTIRINKSFNLVADKGTTIICDALDKTKPALKVNGAVRAKYFNFTVVGAGYQCLSGIQFTTPDSQAIELDSIKVTQCRFGLYSNEAETMNRIVMRNCDFSSNAIAGFYLKSFDVTYGHSAPITFEHTILNSNGPLNWMYNATYKGQPVIDSSDKFGYQIYCKGFGKLTWKEGQISNHAQAKNLAMGYFENGSGLSIYSPDFEDFTSSCNRNGDLILGDYSNIVNNDEGSAIVIKSVSGVFAEMSHVWQINSKSIFKLIYQCDDVTILNVPKVGTLKYTIDTAGTNEGSNPTRLYTNSDLSLLSPSAFNCIDYSVLTQLDEQSALIPENSHNTVFDNVGIASGKYTFGYCIDANNPSFRNAAYSEKDLLGNEKVFFAELECTQGSFSPQGMFFVESLDSTGTRTGYAWIDTKGMYSYKGSYFSYLHYLIPDNSVKVRYGFVNVGNYTGNVPTHATVKKYTVFVYSPYRSGFLTSQKKTSIERNIKFLDAIPSNPTVPVTFERGLFYLNGTDTLGWICLKSGTIGNITLTCNGNIGTNQIVVSSSISNLRKGQYITIDTLSDIFKIIDIVDTTVFLSANLSANVVSKTITYSAPKMSRIDAGIEWVFVNFANYTPSTFDKYIELDATSNSIFINMPDPTTNAGRQLTFKRVDTSSQFVTLSGTIEGQTFRLRANDSATVVSDGTAWRIISQNKNIWSIGSFDSSGTIVISNPQFTVNTNLQISVKSVGSANVPAIIDYVATSGSATITARKADKTIETNCNTTIIYSIISY